MELRVTRLYELESRWWFLMGLLFFFVSLFGIFDMRTDKRFLSYEYKATLTLTGDAHVQFRPCKYGEGQVALASDYDCEAYEHTNVYRAKTELKKRRRALAWTKAGLWLVLIAVIVVLAIRLL